MNDGFFTPQRQFRRVLAADWSIHRFDLLWSAFYAGIGFYASGDQQLPRLIQNREPSYLFAPFALAGLAVAFLAYRFYAAERQRATADFYMNLPRGRKLAWTAHAALLAATVLCLEAFIFLCAALRLNLPMGAPGYAIPPHLVLLPPFSATLAVWMNHFNRLRPGGLAHQILRLFLAGVVFGGLLSLHEMQPHLRGLQELLLCALLLGLTPWMLADARRRWLRTQIGALP